MEPLFLDTETTDSDENARLVQLAYKEANTDEIVNELFKPPVPISIDAMAVHHITNEMVEDKPPFIGSATRERLIAVLPERILVAHSAPFDIRVLANEGVETQAFINTLRVARHVVDAPKHSLQYLRYFLKLNVKAQAHDAAGDVLVLESLYDHLVTVVRERFQLALGQPVAEKMLELTQAPVLLKTLSFGKYEGQTFDTILFADKPYLRTLLEIETQRPAHERNEDLIHTLKYTLD
ncbi:3'-5' exonuclease [Candidatus Peregrinibacteria bacterium]|nr:3'-5' exonuclease [Candidatus Peregrinibacteria bacterium]